MPRTGQLKGSEIIQRLVEIGTQTIVEQTDMPRAHAHQAMREAVHRFASEYGGTEMYFPKDGHYELEKRDLLVFDRARAGDSTSAIAADLRLTDRQVRNIVRYMRGKGVGAVPAALKWPGSDKG